MEYNEDPAIVGYRAIWRELKPSRIERMELRYAESGTLLMLVLCPANRNDSRWVECVFHDVADLSFGPGTFFPYLSLLQIDSIKDWQWEGKHYAIHNDEQDNKLRFYCHHFDITILPAGDTIEAEAD